MIHPSIELLSQLLSGAMLSTLLRSALHTKPFCTNSKWETSPKIPSQAWACSPELNPSFPSYPQASLTVAFQEDNWRNMSHRAAAMRKTTVAAQTVIIINTCTAESVVQLCHLGLPRHFFDAFICQSVEDKVRNSWGDWGIQLRNKAKQKKGKGQLLDQLICSATLPGDMSMKFIEDGKVHLWVIKDTRRLSQIRTLSFSKPEKQLKSGDDIFNSGIYLMVCLVLHKKLPNFRVLSLKQSTLKFQKASQGNLDALVSSF